MNQKALWWRWTSFKTVLNVFEWIFAHFQDPQNILLHILLRKSVALVQVFRGMNVIIFNRCAVPKGAQCKERLTDVSWITPQLWTESNFRSVAGAKEIDIAATLEHLRDQRAGMVQTKVRSPALSWRGRGGGDWEGGSWEGLQSFKQTIVYFMCRFSGNDVIIYNCFRISKRFLRR